MNSPVLYVGVKCLKGSVTMNCGYIGFTFHWNRDLDSSHKHSLLSLQSDSDMELSSCRHFSIDLLDPISVLRC